MPIAYHRVFAFWVGVCGAVFLSQAIYWSKRTRDKDGWFYKTREEWTAETGLTRDEQETARKRCIRAGLLKEKRSGQPARMYYKVILDPILTLSSWGESTQLDGGKAPNKNGALHPTIYTEITTEITPITEDKPIVNNEELQEGFNKWKTAKEERKNKKGRGLYQARGFTPKPTHYPRYEKKERTAVFAEDVV